MRKRKRGRRRRGKTTTKKKRRNIYKTKMIFLLPRPHHQTQTVHYFQLNTIIIKNMSVIFNGYTHQDYSCHKLKPNNPLKKTMFSKHSTTKAKL
jgi:hypothetical protein